MVVGKGTQHLLRCLVPQLDPLGRSLIEFSLAGMDVGIRVFTWSVRHLRHLKGRSGTDLGSPEPLHRAALSWPPLPLP